MTFEELGDLVSQIEIHKWMSRYLSLSVEAPRLGQDAKIVGSIKIKLVFPRLSIIEDPYHRSGISLAVPEDITLEQLKTYIDEGMDAVSRSSIRRSYAYRWSEK